MTKKLDGDVVSFLMLVMHEFAALVDRHERVAEERDRLIKRQRDALNAIVRERNTWARRLADACDERDTTVQRLTSDDSVIAVERRLCQCGPEWTDRDRHDSYAPCYHVDLVLEALEQIETRRIKGRSN